MSESALTKRLLLIDDSPDIGDLIAVIAAPLGFACEQAVTFAAFKELLAADAASDSDAAVIVVDLIMPGTDGIEVLRYLAEQKCRAGILLLSGANRRVLAVAEEMARASNLKVLGGLGKPIARPQLEAILRREASAVVPGSMRQPAEHLISEEELRRAITEDQFVLHGQPQIDIKTGAASGVEMLVRWQHPLHGLLFPDAFIGLSEQWYLVDDLTWLIVDKALKAAQLFAAHQWHPAMSINISAFSLQDVTLPDRLFALAEAAGVSPSQLTVEITESGAIEKVAAVLDIVTRLRLRGFGLSIDDFGTGFSMMHQLRRIPANELKIDKEFIRTMDHDSDARIIVRKTVEIGHEMSMVVVAEGVETQEQLRMLAELGCDIAQGYLFAKPMPAEELVAWHQQLEASRSDS